MHNVVIQHFQRHESFACFAHTDTLYIAQIAPFSQIRSHIKIGGTMQSYILMNRAKHALDHYDIVSVLH